MAPPFHGQMHHRPDIGMWLPSVEFVYAIIIVAVCLFIFFRTRELSELTQHKGIFFFRQTFLFFAIAFFTRLIPTLFRLSDLHLPGYRLGFYIGILFFGYASSLAVMSMAKSALWKHMKTGFWSNPFVYHIIAIVLALSMFIDHSGAIFLLVQGILIIFTLVLSYREHYRRRKKKSSSLSYYTYMLLAVFWLLNTLAIFVISKVLIIPIITIYFISIVLFMIVLLRVMLSLKG